MASRKVAGARCPNCGSLDTYADGVEHVCRNCGRMFQTGDTLQGAGAGGGAGTGVEGSRRFAEEGEETDALGLPKHVHEAFRHRAWCEAHGRPAFDWLFHPSDLEQESQETKPGTEDAKALQDVMRCPNCGSSDVQVSGAAAACSHCAWTGASWMTRAAPQPTPLKVGSGEQPGMGRWCSICQNEIPIGGRHNQGAHMQNEMHKQDLHPNQPSKNPMKAPKSPFSQTSNPFSQGLKNPFSHVASAETLERFARTIEAEVRDIEPYNEDESKQLSRHMKSFGRMTIPKQREHLKDEHGITTHLYPGKAPYGVAREEEREHLNDHYRTNHDAAPDEPYVNIRVHGFRRNPGFEGHQRALNLATRNETFPVKDCKFCGHAIAWVKSKKTGKNYPADVGPAQSMEDGRNTEQLRVAPWKVHTRETCQKNKEYDESIKRMFEQ